MVTGDFWVLLAMLLYFIVVVLIGFVYAKKSNASSEAYFLGGRGLGPWLTALSAEASDMSGWLLMGLPGVAYWCGVSDAAWTAIGLAIGTYLNWKFVAKRLRKYSEVANNSITVPDFFSNRFHDNKHVLMTIAAIITLVFFSIYTGSCFVTCGKLFSTLFGLDYATMMVLGAIIVFLYTFVGGYLSVCTTDLIQGTLMFFALATVFIGSVAQAGGVENTVAFLHVGRTAPHGYHTETEIVGTEAHIRVAGVPWKDRVMVYDQYGARQEIVENFPQRFAEAYLLEMVDFIDCIQKGRKPELTVYDGTKATLVTYAITDSFHTGKPVQVKY